MKVLALLAFTLPAVALPHKLEPDIVYTEEFAPEGITLRVIKPGYVLNLKKVVGNTDPSKKAPRPNSFHSPKKPITFAENAVTAKEFPDGLLLPLFPPRSPTSSKNSKPSTPANLPCAS